MNNQKIIEVLKKDIKELKLKGFEYKVIKGLSILGSFDVDLMVYIPDGISGFNKSYRTIKFKTNSSRENFLKETEEVLKWNSKKQKSIRRGTKRKESR